jgi:hypothetical protein
MAYNNYNYLSLISLLLDDEIQRSVVDIFNWEGFTDVMGLRGRYVETKQPVYHDYVNADIGIQVIAESVSNSGTATITIVATSGTTGYAKKNYLCMFPNGKVGHIQSVTTTSDKDSFTIQTNDGTTLTLSVGQKIDVFSKAVGEASIAGANVRRSLTKYLNRTQIITHINEETDISKVSPVRVDFKGQPYFYLKNIAEKMMEWKGWVNGMCIGGTLGDTGFEDTSGSLIDPDGGGNVQTSRGLDQYATTYGVDDDVASAGTWTLADHGDVIDQLLAKRALIGEYDLYMASKVKRKLDDHLKNLGSSNVNSVRLTAAANATTRLNFEVDQFNYGGMTANLIPLRILDNNKMFSQTDIIKSIYYVPTDSVKTFENGNQPRVSMRYQSHGIADNINKGDKIWGEWHSGPMSRVTPQLGIENDRSIWRTNWKTIQGVHILGAQHLAKSTVLA